MIKRINAPRGLNPDSEKTEWNRISIRRESVLDLSWPREKWTREVGKIDWRGAMSAKVNVHEE